MRPMPQQELVRAMHKPDTLCVSGSNTVHRTGTQHLLRQIATQCALTGQRDVAHLAKPPQRRGRSRAQRAWTAPYDIKP